MQCLQIAFPLNLLGRSGCSQSTSDVYQRLKHLGGDVSVTLMSKVLGGPNAKTIHSKIEENEIEHLGWNIKLIDRAIAYFQTVHSYHGPFQFSIDATPILPKVGMFDKITGRVVGFMEYEDIEPIENLTVNQLQNLWKENRKPATGFYVGLLSCLGKRLPPYVVFADTVKGKGKENHLTCLHWRQKLTEFGGRCGVKIPISSSDGDPKQKKDWKNNFHISNLRNLHPDQVRLIGFPGEAYGGLWTPAGYHFPNSDIPHLMKNARMSLLDPNTLMILGDFYLSSTILEEMRRHYKNNSGLWLTDTNVKVRNFSSK
jgi:hypothetical protein